MATPAEVTIRDGVRTVVQMRSRCVALVLLVLLLLGCTAEATVETTAETELVVAATPTPTTSLQPVAEPTAEPTPTNTPEPTVQPDPTPTPEKTPTPTVEPEPSSTPEAETPEPAAEPAPAEEPAGEVPTPDPEYDKTLPPVTYDGDVKAIRTASGAVVAVRGVSASGYEVVTPCYNIATINGGLELTGPIDVLIDPGHGGAETGAVGPNGLVEADVNLRVSELLRDELVERGYTVAMTRYGDVRVAIQSRTELANALQPRVFMSVHHNGGFPTPLPWAGTEVFVQQGDPDGMRLGGLVFEEIQAAFADVDIDWMGNIETHGVAWRQNRQGTDLYGILRRTPGLVTVLTEAMFLTTEAEAELLAKPETLVTEASALANALDRWFTTDDPGTGFIDGIVFQGDLGSGGSTDGCVDPNLG